jgi:hypothetical protein
MPMLLLLDNYYLISQLDMDVHAEIQGVKENEAWYQLN